MAFHRTAVNSGTRACPIGGRRSAFREQLRPLLGQETPPDGRETRRRNDTPTPWLNPLVARVASSAVRFRAIRRALIAAANAPRGAVLSGEPGMQGQQILGRRVLLAGRLATRELRMAERRLHIACGLGRWTGVRRLRRVQSGRT